MEIYDPKLDSIIKNILPIDQLVFDEAFRKQSTLTKPEGSLGFLELISAKIAAIKKDINPKCDKKLAILMVGDHGIAIEGVSAYPQSVTIEMLRNFSNGGAAVNVLARSLGCKLKIVDIGTNSSEEDIALIKYCRVSKGTKNMLHGPAMTQLEAIQAIEIGIDTFFEEYETGIDIFATGDMGIGNTTSSSAITSVICNRLPKDVTGPGTGLSPISLKRKIEIIERVLAINTPNRHNPIELLSKLGGFEIAGIVGTILAASSLRVPIVLDGFISTASALIAAEMAPTCKAYMFAGHISTEPGHHVALDYLGLKPILNLGLRLGEGTGAILAMSIVENACKILCDMATFDGAKVSKKL